MGTPRLTKLLGTTLPLVQAPMAGVQDSALAVAVSNAGGLGSLPAALLPPDRLRDEIQTIKAQTSRPFNVNFFCHTRPSHDEAREAKWRESLAPYYRELDIDLQGIGPGPGRAPFDDDAADTLAALNPPIVSFHFGLPTKRLLERVRKWRPTIISSATTVDEALWLEAHGVDAIVAQGLEAGGHRATFLSGEMTTQLGTIALVRQIVNAVKVPVIAAGGIADAEGIAAVLALGAVAAQIGTAFLLCPETSTTRVHREALASPRARHTAVTNVFTGRPARAIVNRLVAELGPMSPFAPAFPLATAAVVPLRTKAESQGSGDFSPMWSGQNASGCRHIPAAELTVELAGRFE
jgi:nitronate monooxygenase